jgi:hypothetical protein
MLPTPSKKTHPNHKIDKFLSHVNRTSMMAWDLGSHASRDEQTIGFQGHHQEKMRINYKKEGDGFQADCICENGYTYSFYFCNVPAPKKYMWQCVPVQLNVVDKRRIICVCIILGSCLGPVVGGWVGLHFH